MIKGEQTAILLKITVAVLLPFPLLNYVYSQVWIRTYDGPVGAMDNSYAISLDCEGNVLVTGYASISHNGDTVPNYCTIKYDPDGNLQWVRFFDYGLGLAVATDSNGNVLITGTKGTIKYRPDGDVAWIRTYGQHFWGNDLIADPQGNVYVTGYIAAPMLYQAITIKYSAQGDQEWAILDSSDGSWTVSIALDTAGNVYVAGFGTRIPGRPAYLVMKYAPDGNLLWRVCDELLNGVINKLKLTQAGDIYVTGSLNDEAGPYAAATVRYNTFGQQQWVRFFDGPGYDYGQTLAVDADGNCYVAIGTAEHPGPVTNFDIVIIKYAPDGSELWQRRYTGYGGSEEPLAIGIDARNCCYVGGYSQSPRDTILRDDYTLLKYDSLGELQWAARYYVNSLLGWLYDLEIDNQGYIYTTGFIATGTMANFDYDWCIIKYPPTGPGVAEIPVSQFNQLQFTLYPNPAHQSFSIRSTVAIQSIRLYDIAGKLVRVYNHIEGNNKLSLAGVPTGVYLVKIQTQDSRTTQKLIVR